MAKNRSERRFFAAIYVAVLLVLILAGCSANISSNNEGVVDVDKWKVSERDLEIARQMGAPEQVIESMEEGEWLAPSDRQAVRYAEIAIDHMVTSHGQTCEARWSTVPWIVDSDAKVTLVAKGGDYDGREVIVCVSSKKDHKCTDDWYAVSHLNEYELAISSALTDALGGLPEESWSYLLWQPDMLKVLDDDTSIDEAMPYLKGYVHLYLAPSAAETQEDLEKLAQAVEHSLLEIRFHGSYCIRVLNAAPDDGVMTPSFGYETSRDSSQVRLSCHNAVEGGRE